MLENFERIVEILPAYDKTKEGYGIHGAELRMVLKGQQGAVQFVLYTNWQLPHVEQNLIKKVLKDAISEEAPSEVIKQVRTKLNVYFLPMPADLGYHSKTPHYEGQYLTSDCQYIEGGCYYDGSGLNAEPVYQILLTEGSDGVWKYLEQYHKEIFGDN